MLLDDPHQLPSRCIASPEQQPTNISRDLAPQRLRNIRALIILAVAISIGVTEHYWRQWKLEQHLHSDAKADRQAASKRSQDIADVRSAIANYHNQMRTTEHAQVARLLKQSPINENPDPKLVAFQAAQADTFEKKPATSSSQSRDCTSVEEALAKLTLATNAFNLKPNAFHERGTLAKALLNAGAALATRRQNGDLTAAIECLERSNQLFEELVSENPILLPLCLCVNGSQYLLATCYQKRGAFDDQQKAIQYFQSSRDAAKRLVSKDIYGNGSFAGYLRSSCGLSWALMKRKLADDQDNAELILVDCIQRAKSCPPETMNEAMTIVEMAQIHHALGALHKARQRDTEARSQLRQACDLLEDAITRGIVTDRTSKAALEKWSKGLMAER